MKKLLSLSKTNPFGEISFDLVATVPSPAVSPVDFVLIPATVVIVPGNGLIFVWCIPFLP